MPAATLRPPAVALLEIHSLGAALVVLDQVEKAALVQVLQAELNDHYGLFLKLIGDAASVRIALETARQSAAGLHAACTAEVIDSPDAGAWGVIASPPEYQPLLEQEVVFIPGSRAHSMTDKTATPGALGLIETQGFTAVTAATDAACKAAGVRVIAKEKLGGGYITPSPRRSPPVARPPSRSASSSPPMSSPAPARASAKSSAGSDRPHRYPRYILRPFNT
jgi:microcompartment protein CcmL/EutN